MKYIVSSLFLTLLLSACSISGPSKLETQDFQTINPSNLIGLSGEEFRLINEDTGNCPIDEIKIPGEGSRVQGGSGGFFTQPFSISTVPDDINIISQEVLNLASPHFDQPTALFVVDDFNGQGLKPGVYLPNEETVEGIFQIESGMSAEERTKLLEELEANHLLSHGALVYNHTLALLATIDPNMTMRSFQVHKPAPSLTFNEPPFNFERFAAHITEFSNLNLTVVAVDTEDFNTSVIAGRIAATIQEVGQRGISHIAVNMSFGLVPCSVLEDFTAVKQRYPTFEAYRDEIMRKNAAQVRNFKDELTEILTTPVGKDPLQLLAQFNPEAISGNVDAVAYLASAGNYGMNYSLFPAHWPEFASVSASDLSVDPSRPLEISHKDAAYSNSGEILLPGGYYQLNLYYPGGGWQPIPDIAFAGTSFAAPVLSVFTALDFTSRAPQCPVTHEHSTSLAHNYRYGLGQNETLKNVMGGSCARHYRP